MSSLQKTGKWWVLAVGDSFGDAGFDGRDLCRAKLLNQVESVGIILDEYVWVFDEGNRAQLVLEVCVSRERAEERLEKLKETGLSLKLAREFE